jgi:hypothetical protein
MSVKKFNYFIFEGKFEEIDSLKKFVQMQESELDYQKLEWLIGELCNDEDSSDLEMVEHFIKEGDLTKDEAKEWVSKRSIFIKYPMEAGAILDKILHESLSIQNEAASPLQKEYRDFFTFLLSKYGVKSPREFGKDREKSTKFYADIQKGWNKGKGVSAYGKKLMEEKPEKVDESAHIDKFDEMKNWFESSSDFLDAIYKYLGRDEVDKMYESFKRSYGNVKNK